MRAYETVKAFARIYLAGVSLGTFARGNRRMLAAVQARRAQRAKEAKKAARKAAAKAKSTKPGEKETPATEPRRTVPAWECAAWSAGGLFLLWPTIGPAVPVTLGTLVAVWVVAAVIAGQGEEPGPAAAPVDGSAEAGKERIEEEPAPTVPTAPEVHHLTARLAAGGESVLLTRLAAELGAAHPSWQRSTKAVRALLAQAHIPVRAGVRTPDGNGHGVHHADAPPIVAALATAVVADVGADQSGNTNANNGEATPGQEGYVLQADPANPARTIVVHIADAA